MKIGYFPTFYETVNIEYLWMSLPFIWVLEPK